MVECPFAVVVDRLCTDRNRGRTAVCPLLIGRGLQPDSQAVGLALSGAGTRATHRRATVRTVCRTFPYYSSWTSSAGHVTRSLCMTSRASSDSRISSVQLPANLSLKAEQKCCCQLVDHAQSSTLEGTSETNFLCCEAGCRLAFVWQPGEIFHTQLGPAGDGARARPTPAVHCRNGCEYAHQPRPIGTALAPCPPASSPPPAADPATHLTLTLTPPPPSHRRLL